jgi:ATP-dependent DNA helicase RecG
MTPRFRFILELALMPLESPQDVRQQLARPIQFEKGVGPQLAQVLERIGLRTVRDVLFFFPRDYEDVSRICSIEDLSAGEPVTILGTITEAELRNTGPGKSVFGVVVRDATQSLRAVWFNQPFMEQRMRVGRRVLLSGVPRRRGVAWEMNHPRVEYLDDEAVPREGRILPVYSLTSGLNQSRIRHVAHRVVDQYASAVEEILPKSFRQQHRLCDIETALREIHSPSSQEQIAAARRRFAFQELFLLQLTLCMQRWLLQHEAQAIPLPQTTKIDARIRRRFPFELTEDQQRAIREIAADMSSHTPMNRLLQGEVGSGKTVVAEYAMLLAVAHGCQAALMAPTEVLAHQHLRVLQRDLSQSRVRMELLTGAMSDSQRRDLQNRVAAGDVDLVIGTTALLNEDLAFRRLGLVVIDEQHKFGVRQRAALQNAAEAPHFLIMTATPIPRTVTMALFGDLDVSTLRGSPSGRQSVHTYLGQESQRGQWWEFFGKKLREGRQGYVVVPRVEQSESDEVASVQQRYEQLANGPLEAFRVGLIHGRLAADDKQAVMEAFRQRRIQVLIGTSVLEVGIDVPNATLMTIENGERFGLAQLHQLRGRIRRGSYPGYLCVFAAPNNEQSHTRLEAFVNSMDGFELAEVDFQLRGPGDPLGTRQHGVPRLRVADLHRDQELLLEARTVAQQLFTAPAAIFEPEFQKVRQRVEKRLEAAR